MDSGLNLAFFENVFTSPDDIFQRLEKEVIYLPANDCKIRIKGKSYPIARQLAAFGEPDLTYSFSGLTIATEPWTPLLQEIKTAVENISGNSYNFVLVNRYRDGDSYISQHKDNEPDMDEQCTISSLSFGETRTIVFKKPGFADHKIELKDNSLIVMKPPTNSEWSHGIPRQKKRSGVRLNLTFRKMKRHTLKRSQENEEMKGNINKKLKTRESKDSGVFKEDAIPEGVFPIGGSVFVIPTTFEGKVMVHLRKYRKYGNTYYPTAEGVTLRPEWSEHIMGRTKVPESERDLPVSLFASLNEIKITSKDFNEFTFTRTKTVNKSITISTSQWTEMIRRYDDIATTILDHVFGAMDIYKLYSSINEGVLIESALPSSLDVSLGTQHLYQVLNDVICDLLKETGLKMPDIRAEELWAQNIKTFNSAAFCLNAQEIVDNFYHRLWDNTNFLLMKPAMYVTQEFFNTLHLNDILKSVRKAFCPEDTFEFFENIDEN